MVDVPDLVESVVQSVHLPAGMAGPEPMEFDVRCFLLRDRSGLLLVDAGMNTAPDDIGSALSRLGAQWADLTDIIITHSHPDHTGGLQAVTAQAPGATVWAGGPDISDIRSEVPVRPLHEGDYVRPLRVISAPGHTKGHICLLWESEGLLFAGDAVGTVEGVMTRPPAPFTADPAAAEATLGKLAALDPVRMLFSHGDEVPDPVHQLRRLVVGG